MTLEERYNAAGNDTYVGKVKNLQAADAGAGSGVNFLDGEGKGKWSSGTSPAPDQYQTEFTRGSEGDFRYSGGGKVPGSPDNTYSLSRWLPVGLDKAFGAGGYYANNRYTTISDPRNASTLVHKYAPLSGKDFIQTLQEMGKGRVNGAPSGPSPAGLAG